MADEIVEQQSEAQPQQPAPTQPTLQSHDAERDRAAEHERQLAAARAEAEQVRQQAAAREQQWQAHYQQLAQQQQQHAQPQAETFGDDDLLTGKQFKLAAANLMQTLAGATQSEIVKIHKTQRAANREYARGRLPNFSKYETDIEAYLDKVPPEVASNPAVYDEAYKLARAKYVDDDIAAGTEAAALRRARELLEAKGLDPADFGLDDAQPSPTGSAATAPSPSPQGRMIDVPSIPGNATRPAVSVRSPAKPAVRLNQQQSYIANRFGVSAEDYIKYGNDTEEVDFLGFKGRSRV